MTGDESWVRGSIVLESIDRISTAGGVSLEAASSGTAELMNHNLLQSSTRPSQPSRTVSKRRELELIGHFGIVDSAISLRRL